MKQKVIRLVLVAALALPLGTSASNDEATLEMGIRQAKEGDLSKALVTLDAVIQRLTPDATNHAKELSQAHLYKGIAFVGLAQEEAAKAAFRDALHYDPALRLRKGEQPDRVVRIFDAARTGKTKSVLERPSDAPKKAGIGALGIAGIVGGVVVLGGAAVAVGGGSTPNTAPSGSFTFSPTTPAFLGATVVTFNAIASDAEADAITFNWNFGDGTQGAGQSVTHVFNVEGLLTVVLTLNDAKGAQTTVSNSVTVRSITGRWRFSSAFSGSGCTFTCEYQLTQQQTSVSGAYTRVFGPECRFPLSSNDHDDALGTVSDPRHVRLTISSTPPRSWEYDLDPTLTTMCGESGCGSYGCFDRQ